MQIYSLIGFTFPQLAGSRPDGAEESGQHLLHEQHPPVPEQYGLPAGALPRGHLPAESQQVWTKSPVFFEVEF